MASKMERIESACSKNTFGEESQKYTLKVPLLKTRGHLKNGSRNNEFTKVEVKPLKSLTPTDGEDSRPLSSREQ